jgi:hypothetical protein
MLRVPRRKEVPRDFLKGKIEKFTGKLERAKSAGNEEDITKYTAKVKKFQEQFDALPPEKMEPYELPEGTTDDDADAYVEKRVGRAEGEWREFKEWSLRHWKVYSTKYPGLSDQELIGKMKDAWCALKRKQTPLQK